MKVFTTDNSCTFLIADAKRPVLVFGSILDLKILIQNNIYICLICFKISWKWKWWDRLTRNFICISEAERRPYIEKSLLWAKIGTRKYIPF